MTEECSVIRVKTLTHCELSVHFGLILANVFALVSLNKLVFVPSYSIGFVTEYERFVGTTVWHR